jgi:hypothetical protein
MWTLYDWLEKQGLAPAAKIEDGQPMIEGVKLHIPLEETKNDAEVWAVESGFATEGSSTLLRFQQDQILLPRTNLAVIHNQVLDAFRFYNDWEKELLLCMLDSSNLQNLLDVAHRVFKRPMFIKSDSSLVYAITKEYDESVHPDWARMQDNILKLQADFNAVKTVSLDSQYQATFTETYPCIRQSPFYCGEVLHANVWLKERRICEIVTISHGRSFNPGDTHLMNFFAQIVQRVIQANFPLYQPHSGIATFFIDMLKTESFDALNLAAVLKTLNWHENDELIVLCAAIQARYNTPILNVLREKFTEQLRHSCSFSYLGDVICIANTAKEGGVTHIIQKAEKIIPREIFTWGASYEFYGLENVPAYYRQAHLVLMTAQQNSEPYNTMHQIALKMMSYQIQSIPDFATYIHPDISRLRETDRTSNSHYSDTLFQYLLCGGNLTDAANNLGLHRNSLIYRVNKIRDMISSNLDDPEHRKILLISFLFENSDSMGGKLPPNPHAHTTVED